MELTNFWLLPAWVIGMGTFLTLFQRRLNLNSGRKEPEGSKTEYIYDQRTWGIVSCIILVLPLIIWTAYRPETFADTGMYKLTYKYMSDDWSKLSDYYQAAGKDKLFYTFEMAFKCLTHAEYRMFFLLLAVFQLLIIALVLRKYSEDFAFSIIIFVLGCNYISYTWNGVRQFVAVCIILAGTTFIYKKKYIPAILIVLLASGFHKSALLMLPVILIIQGKAWNKKTVLVILLAAIAILFVGEFTTFLDDSLQDTQYQNVVSDYQEIEDDGVNPVRALFFSIPTIIAFVYRKKIEKEDNKFINICVNASILSTTLWVVAVFTSGIYLGRLPIYVGLFANEILLPWELNHLFGKSKSKWIFKVGTILVYFAFYIYQMHFGWGLL